MSEKLMLACSNCGCAFPEDETGLAFNMGAVDEYYCTGCCPPALEKVALFDQFFRPFIKDKQ